MRIRPQANCDFPSMLSPILDPILRGSMGFVLTAILGVLCLSAEDAEKAEADVGDNSAENAEDSEDVLAGHSFHGEAFNEGPRQGAYLMGGTGDVSFPVTTDVVEAQAFFDQGIGQLHGFWYFEAERSFRQVAKLDPDCAMAYWGMAMANFGNEKRATEFIQEAVERKEKASRREQLWIDGLNDYLGSKDEDRGGRQTRLPSQPRDDHPRVSR